MFFSMTIIALIAKSILATMGTSNVGSLLLKYFNIRNKTLNVSSMDINILTCDKVHLLYTMSSTRITLIL